MDQQRWKRIDELARAAADCEAAEREALLARECAGDESLRREVESLIAHQLNGRFFLEAPAVQRAAGLIANSEIESLADQTIARGDTRTDAELLTDFK